MKKLLILFLLLNVQYSFTQTTIEEWKYMTKGYAIQKENGLGTKIGYKEKLLFTTNKFIQEKNVVFNFIELTRLSDKTVCGIIVEFIKNDNDLEIVKYFGIPTPNTSDEIWKQSRESFKNIDNNEITELYITAFTQFISFITQLPTAKLQTGLTTSNRTSSVKTTKVTPKENLMTQKDPSVVAIEEQKKKERQEREAQERKQREEERRIAEQKRKEQDVIDKANNSLGGLFGSGGTTGSRNTTGSTTQGNPAGSSTSGGNFWSVSGRSLSGRLVNPSYDNDLEGVITVQIRVNASGDVISATIGTPTTISDETLRNAAIAAARRTKFSSGNGTAAGSITYNFRLR